MLDSWVCDLLDRTPRGFFASSLDDVPHIVPVVFVRLDDQIYSPVDGKPKSSTRLRRIQNLEKNSCVSFLIDHYGDDWDKLWWLRIECLAKVELLSHEVKGLLRGKYPQYETIATGTTVISMSPTRWRYWSMSGDQ